MIDNHIHTRLCRHAEGEIDAYVESAISRGITEISFTDHIPLPDNFDIAHRMAMSEMDQYATMVRRVQEKYPEIHINFGVEADYYKGFEEFLFRFLAHYPFDVVIMSLHFIRGWENDNWVFSYDFPDRPVSDVYREYLSVMREGIRTGLFDVIGHADLVKSGGRSLISETPAEVAAMLDTVVAAGMAVEINTSGHRRDIRQTYPSLDWLPLLLEKRVPLTMGSDAHSPEQIGLHFHETISDLKKAGVQKLVRYRRRSAEYINL
jgi:histidinol-phosphatase (PHP family)